jgi:hypothetical protein
MDTLNGEIVLKLDFNIKQYKVLTNGWKSHYFLPNTIINDSLYLNKDMTNKVIEILNGFQTTGELEPEGAEYTNRGFSFIKMKDLKGNLISIQKSSTANESCIWFGCATKDKVFLQENDKFTPYPFVKGEVLIEDRLHLNRSKTKILINAIKKHWLKTDFILK